jgi:putative ribosome biogenesis GTPase RsgA
VREAVGAGRISAERYENYCRFLEEIRARRKY